MKTHITSKKQLDSTSTVCFFRLQNGQGISVDVTNWGATLVAALIPDNKGVCENILLGYQSAEKYINDPFYLGATIGPFANRIGNASFQIDGKTYLLDRNDGMNTNHSGLACIGHKCWQWELTEKGPLFSILSPHLEGGYPGNIRIEVLYSLTETNELHITYRAETDRKTYINLTNHAYFNLGKHDEKIDGHLLQVNSEKRLDTDSAFIPTGKFADTNNSPFDFSQLRPIGQYLHDTSNQQIVWNKGYNHCYELRKQVENKAHQWAATLVHPENKRRVDVFTDYPGMLLYTAGYYRNPDTGVCFEAQYFPDTPSHPDFPSCLIEPGEQYHHQIIFKFSIDQIILP
jgi:aldose 1-epimerase